MIFIEYRGEVLSGYVPDLPQKTRSGRGERLRSFSFREVGVEKNLKNLLTFYVLPFNINV